MAWKTGDAARLAKKFSTRADRCRNLAAATEEPQTQSIYRGLAASYEGMAAAMRLSSNGGAQPRHLIVRKS